MKEKPNNILLSCLFYLDEENNLDLKEEIVDAWCKIHRKSKDHLGKKHCINFNPFSKWVHGRACRLKMPYFL